MFCFCIVLALFFLCFVDTLCCLCEYGGVLFEFVLSCSVSICHFVLSSGQELVEEDLGMTEFPDLCEILPSGCIV